MAGTRSEIHVAESYNDRLTGAVGRKIGKFELAKHGTVVLDEIGEMSLPLQAKLLRVLQEGEFEKIGSSETKRVDVRIIAATNRDLRRSMEEGQFHPDLYYRLAIRNGWMHGPASS